MVSLQRSKKYLWMGISLLITTGYNACTQNYDIAKVGVPKESSLAGDGDPQQPHLPYDVSQSITVSTNKKVDVLVVIDNSGSMTYEQSSMASRFNNFVDKLNGFDWHLAITTTDVSGDANLKDGRLVKFDSLNTYVLTSAMNLNSVKAAFGETIQRPPSEGSSNEQGLKASYRNLERYTNMASVNDPIRSFYRSDAALAVLVVSDANETSPSVEIRNTADGLIAKVASVFSHKIFRFHSIVVRTGDTVCRNLKDANGNNDNEGYGSSYEEASNKTGGEVGSVCAIDYASQLGEIGQAIIDAVADVKLSCAPIESSLVIKKSGGGNVSSADYYLDGDELMFINPLAEGSYTIDYTCP